MGRFIDTIELINWFAYANNDIDSKDDKLIQRRPFKFQRRRDEIWMNTKRLNFLIKHIESKSHLIDHKRKYHDVLNELYHDAEEQFNSY